MRTALIVVSSFVLAAAASAQTHGYAFFAPGGSTSSGYTDSNFHLGFGGEGVFKGGFGVGGEVGYLTTRQNFDGGFGLASFNGTYHFNRRAKVVPFVTGGYSLAFRNGTAHLGNVGGGVNWWLRPRIGIKIEFRDHIHRDDLHLWGFRFGVIFR